MIEVKSLTKQYGNNRGVSDINFMVSRGECVGLLGPNGAGKSTIMNMITGYISPTSGTATLHGYDLIKETNLATKHIGFMSEIPPLYVDMTVRQFVSFVCDIKGINRKFKKEESQRVMELSSTADVSKRVIKNLSKGYRQRLGLAQALVGDPHILVLDEPTAGLDPRQIVDVRNMIIGLKEEHTIIISSHILSEIDHMCDRVIIMKDGILVSSDYSPRSADDIHVHSSTHTETFTITVQGDKDSLENLLKKQNIQYEISTPRPSLEDIFLGLTE